MQHRRRASKYLLIGLMLFLAAAVAMADHRIENLINEVVETFDEPAYTWQIFPSKFGIDLEGRSLWQMRYANGWPEALFGRKVDPTRKCLGVRGSFLRKGYNYIEIVPGRGEGADFQPEPIQLSGRVKNLDLWVWGGNYDYSMEVHLRDFTGVDHVLPLGSLRFIGWNNLDVDIPGTIPQARQHIPLLRNLTLTKLVIWTRPTERVDDYTVYIDHIKILTDRFETRFDGDDLTDQERIDEIWGGSKQ